MRKYLAAGFLFSTAVILSGCNTSQVLTIPPSDNSFRTDEAGQHTTQVSSNIKVRFDPVIGAPANASNDLEAQLLVLATQNKLQLVRRGDDSATHVAKGYFSAISENGETTVIYVWDIFNASGIRLHRIQGQTKSLVQNGGGWDNVDSATMQIVAQQTISQLTAWLASSAR